MKLALDGLWQWSIRHPWRVFLACAIAAVAALAQLPQVRVDTDPENMLSAQQPDRVYHNLVKRRFQLHDTIVVGMVAPEGSSIYSPRSLAALHTLSRGIAEIDGVIAVDLMSLATVDNVTQGGPGTVRFEWLMASPPMDAAGARAVADAVKRLPLLQNTLASNDGRAAAVYVPIADKNESRRIALDIQRKIDALDSDDAFHITGLPVAEDTFGHDMFVQMAICAPLAGVVIFLLMWMFFRNALFVVGPMLVAMGCVIVTMGALIGVGHPVHIMSSMIAIFLMPIAVVDAIHIQSDFAERYTPGMSPQALMGEVLHELFKPMLFTSLTTAAGFASLLLTPIPPVQIFGGYVAFGVALAFVLTLTLLPAFVCALPASALARLGPNTAQRSRLADALIWCGRVAQRRRATVLGLSLLAVGLGIAGILRIEVNDNPVRWFKASHPIRVADRTLNAHFAGTYDAFLVLETDSAAHRKRLMSDWSPLATTTLGRDVLALVRDERTPLGNALQTALDRLDGDTGADLDEVDAWVARIETAQSAMARFQDPDALRAMQALQTSLQQSGLVGKSNSLVEIVTTVHRELRGGAASEQIIPQSRAAVAQTLLQFQSSHRPHDLWHFTTTDYDSAAIWLQLRSGDNQDMSRVERYVEDYLQAHPLPDGMVARWAGKTHLNRVWQGEMVNGMAWSLAGAFGMVALMMMLLFRSFVLGLLSMLPLALSIGALYGAIGWIGKDYDMPIAVLSALALGLAVDFAIHFIERARAHYRATGDVDATLEIMFREPGLAIARNAIVIAIGFTPLLFAPLVPYITVGWLLAGIMALSALVTLFLLAALMGAHNGWLFRKAMK